MTRNEAVAELQLGLAFRSDRTTECINALQQVQKLREGGRNSLPWFLLQEDQTLAVTAGTREYSLPTGFLGETEERDGNLRYLVGAHYRWLDKLDYRAAEQGLFGLHNGGAFSIVNGNAILDESGNVILDEIGASSPATVAGAPQAYVLRKTTIRIYPKPDVDYTLIWSYFAADTTLTTDVENQWLKFAPWALIGDAGLKMAALTRDAGAQQYFLGVKQRADAELMGEIVERELRGGHIYMGGRL